MMIGACFALKTLKGDIDATKSHRLKLERISFKVNKSSAIRYRVTGFPINVKAMAAFDAATAA